MKQLEAFVRLVLNRDKNEGPCALNEKMHNLSQRRFHAGFGIKSWYAITQGLKILCANYKVIKEGSY